MLYPKEKIFWERVNYSSGLEFGKQMIEKIFTDDDIINKTVIDIGCGTGIYSFIFKQKGAKEVIGIDISESSINIAKNRLRETDFKNIQFLNADIMNYDFKERHFDVVWCNSMIYYIINPYDVMHKITELVNRKGILFISLQKDTYFAKIINFIRRILYRIPKPLWNFTSLIISAIFFIILFIFHKETNFSRIKNKVLAQYFPVNYVDIKKIKDFFSEKDFRIDKIINSMDVFSFTTDFGLKLQRLS